DELTRKEIIERLHLGRARLFVSSFDRPNIRYRIAEKQSSRKQVLDFIRSEHPGESGIVYCLTRAKVDEAAASLKQHGIKALPYHTGMDNRMREKHQNRFIREDG